MKKLIPILSAIILVVACKNKSKEQEIILRPSVGSTNSVLTVMKNSLWDTKAGAKIREKFGEHQVGLPQPETLVTMSQIDPEGFNRLLNNNRNILYVQIGKENKVSVTHNRFAKPQTIIHVTAKDELDLVTIFEKQSSEIIKTFKDQEVVFRQNVLSKNRLNDQSFETVNKLGVSITIPKTFRLVKDSIGFLWLRQHLKSGIARGDGNNNILLYSLPLKNKDSISERITSIRDEIGKKHIPGSKEGMYMITEQAYTPHVFKAKIDGYEAFETRGKWMVKNDFMAGPFINYTILDEQNNRIIVFEGFTYAPSVNKRDFIFDLEAIGKSIRIN